MATMIHVTPTPYQDLGMIRLRVDTSGDPAPDGLVTLGRRVVATGEDSALIFPAGHWDDSGDLRLVGNSAIVFDSTPPLDTPVRYLAALPGATLAEVTDSVTLDSGGVWRLGDPARPYLDLALTLATSTGLACPPAPNGIIILQVGDDSASGRGELTEIPGAQYPQVATEYLQTVAFQMRFATRTADDRRAAESLLATGDRLMLRAPSDYAIDPRYVLVDEVQVGRISTDHRKTWRVFQVSGRLVAQPAVAAYGWLGARWTDLCSGGYATWAAVESDDLSWGSLASGVAGGGFPSAMRTWDEVAATWATWADLTATGKTWADVTAGS